MRLLRLRFTVRRMMIATSVVAGMLGPASVLSRRAEAFRLRSDQLSIEWMNLGYHDQDSPAVRTREEYLAGLVEKYRYAARYPWLPVEPDPPEPE
jgi:hypothetical protein